MIDRTETLVLVSASAAAGAVVGWLSRSHWGKQNHKRFFEIDANTNVHIVEDMRTLDDLCTLAIEEIERECKANDEEIFVVGMDTEWSDGNERVAMLQLAFKTHCLLIRPDHIIMDEKNLHHIESSKSLDINVKQHKKEDKDPSKSVWPRSFFRLLEHPKVVFAGAAVDHDAKLIKQQLGLDCTGATVDLQKIARALKLDKDNGIGLQGLTKTVLGADLSKEHRIRCGDWGAGHLTQEQINYAAADAVVGREILLRMHKHSPVHVASHQLSVWLTNVAQVVMNHRQNTKDKKKKQDVGSLDVANSTNKYTGAGNEEERKTKVATGQTLAQRIEHRCHVSAGFARCHYPFLHPYLWQGTGGSKLLSDPRVIPGVRIKASSHAKGLPATNCLALQLASKSTKAVATTTDVVDAEVVAPISPPPTRLGNDFFLAKQDWRADKRACVLGTDPEIEVDVTKKRPQHWLEVTFPEPVTLEAFSLTSTASAACHTNGPCSWVLSAAVNAVTADVDVDGDIDSDVDVGVGVDVEEQGDRAETYAASNGDHGGKRVQWVPIHVVGLQLPGRDADAATQVWDYDTNRFSNGQIPGDTKYFDIADTELTRVKATKFRWTFFHGDKRRPFSVNIASLMMFGTTDLTTPPPLSSSV
eukprot:m.61648 g.61648  ORF g.61648 m.61648 type:complete len:643 (-) comp23017_c0_seq1:46-1974(-)